MTLHPLTLRQIFDTVKTHLLTQRVRALDSDGMCLYRGEGGKRCAVGCLIPDEAYSESLEGYGIGSLEVQAALKGVVDFSDGASSESLGLLQALQLLHDDDEIDPTAWEESFDEIEAKFFE